MPMASKTIIFLAINVLLFAIIAGATYCPSPPTPELPIPKSGPPPSPSTSHGTCPRDALKLGVCVKVLGLIKAKIGTPPYTPCCSLLDGLVDLEAAVCLCTAIKANVLPIDLNLPIDLGLMLNNCGRVVPSGFKCAY